MVTPSRFAIISRNFPVLTETNIDPAGGVVSYVYEFATNQANGIIRSVCLTHPMGALYSEMTEAPDASPTNIDRLAFGGALGGDQLLTGLLATDCYPTNVYRIMPKTTRNRMGNRILNSISIPV